MQLSQQHIEEFQQLYQRQFGQRLSAKDAAERGTQLVELMRHVYKPMTREQYRRHMKKP